MAGEKASARSVALDLLRSTLEKGQFLDATLGLGQTEQTDDTVKFVQDNATKFFILSLRLFKDIASLQGDDDAGDWRTIVEATKFRV